MAGRLGTRSDIVMTESVLGKLLETMDSMLLESPLAGVMLSGNVHEDDNGAFTEIIGMSEESPVGLCVASSEGGTEPTDSDIILFKRNLECGILMKADVYAHQFSFYKVGDSVEDATVLFSE